MGAYGAFANIIAIPLTTFVIMPLEAVALLLDPLGLAGPVWLLVKWTLSLLIALAEWTATLPGGVTLAPAIPQAAFGLMVAGGLWLVRCRAWTRLAGVGPFMAGAMSASVCPVPALLITRHGRHVRIATHRQV